MTKSPTPLPNFAPDTWIKASWEEFTAFTYNRVYENGKAYYDRGKARIEMKPLGINYAEDTSIIDTLVTIFCSRKGIPMRGLNHCRFRKTNRQECQPNLAFYLNFLDNSPPRSNSPVNLDNYAPPTLVIQLASSSLNSELEEKRQLYESLGVQEYWVIDVTNATAIAFAIADGSSSRIEVSQVLPGLLISFVQTTLERSRLEEKSATTRWLWSEFGQYPLNPFIGANSSE